MKKEKVGELYGQKNTPWEFIWKFSTRQSKKNKKVEVLYTGNDVKIIEDLIDKAVSDGDEGIMLNDAEGLYLCKRNKGVKTGLEIKHMKL